MLLAQSQGRLLYIAAGVFVVLVFGFLIRPSVPQWPTSAGSAAVIEDSFPQHDFSGDDKFSHAGQQQDDNSHEISLTAEPHEALATITAVSPTQSTTSQSHEQHNTPTTSSISSLQENGTALLQQEQDGLDGYVQIFSKMTPDKKWFPIDFGDYGSYNPNLLPHPFKDDTYVMIAQGAQAPGDAQGLIYSLELVCDAVYKDGKMQCLRSPTSVPIASTVSDHCTGDLEWFNYFVGPTDPRVFFGPDRPYITYGSLSQYTCLGQWIHDLRRLVRWNSLDALDRTQRFFWPTELQRPSPYGGIEKNWFAFWDDVGDMYLHYNIYPKRVYAQVSSDGKNISEDLSHATAERDEKCLTKYMSALQEKEHIHQATNSLAITMCKRTEAACDVKFSTFVFTIFHHKQFHGHNLYEPYIMMIKQSAPFDIHAISSKPFWINGRGKAGTGDPNRPSDQSQMMYITSMAWKAQNMTYHGYLDDELLINFGIEDQAAGAIDVVAGDLLKEMSICT